MNSTLDTKTEKKAVMEVLFKSGRIMIFPFKEKNEISLIRGITDMSNFLEKQLKNGADSFLLQEEEEGYVFLPLKSVECIRFRFVPIDSIKKRGRKPKKNIIEKEKSDSIKEDVEV